MTNLFRDLKYGARMMRRSTGFSLAMVLTLALGIGATTAIFSVVYGVLIRPLPYRDPERLALIRMDRVAEGTRQPVGLYFPLSALADWRAHVQTFESVGFYSTELSRLSRDGLIEMVDTASVSDSFFGIVGGRLRRGRGLGASSDDRASVVISDRLGRRLFGEPSDAIGGSLTIGGQPYAIVGVADRTFQLPSARTDVWLPAADPKCCPYLAIARLPATGSIAAAEAGVQAALPALIEQNPRLYEGARATVVSVHEALVGKVRQALWVLMAAVGLLLAVASANAASLMSARNAARAREAAVRSALGASAYRLSLQSLAEGGVIVSAGGAIGILLAASIIKGLAWVGPEALPQLDAVRIDLPVLGFAVCLVGMTTAIMGLLPALKAGNVLDALKNGGAGTTLGVDHRWLHRALVVTELALSLMLLVGAGLLGRSLVRLLTTDLGVRTDRVATAALNLSFERRLTDEQQLALVDTTLERIRSFPGVESAGVGTGLPPNTSNVRLTLKRFGDTVDYQATAVPATPGYFPALGVQLLRGRLFAEGDDDGREQVMIMSENTARRFFGEGDPVGRTMTLPIVRNGVAGSVEAKLVGIIANIKYSGLDAAPDDTVYRPLRQQPWPLLFLVARTTGGPGTLAAQLRTEIAAIDRAILVSSVATLDSIMSDASAQPRFRTALLSSLAAAALIIASVGLYAVVAYTVSRRRNEIGIRMALGAYRYDVLMMVLREGAGLTLAGLLLGIATSMASTRILTTLLYGIEPTDGTSYVMAAALLVVVASVAALVPALTASRLDPLAAIRTE